MLFRSGGRRGKPSTKTPDITHNAPLGNPPESMGKIACELWRHIQKTMEWVGDPDRFLVQELCNLYEMKEIIRLKFEMGINEVSLEVPNQGKRLHPEIQLMKDLQTQITAMMREIGMSPQARKDLEISKPENTDNPLLAYASRTVRRQQERGAK